MFRLFLLFCAFNLGSRDDVLLMHRTSSGLIAVAMANGLLSLSAVERFSFPNLLALIRAIS